MIVSWVEWCFENNDIKLCFRGTKRLGSVFTQIALGIRLNNVKQQITRFTSRRLISTQSRSLYFLLLIFCCYFFFVFGCRLASYYKLALHYCSIKAKMKKRRRKNAYNFLWCVLACRHTDTLMRWAAKLNAHLMTNLCVVTFNGSTWYGMGKTKTQRSRCGLTRRRDLEQIIY